MREQEQQKQAETALYEKREDGTIVLRADVYDKLAAAAEEFDGVGRTALFRCGTPVCAYGLAIHAGVFGEDFTEMNAPDIYAFGLDKYSGPLGFGWHDNDSIVAERGRLPFAQWVTAMNIVRGDE